MPPTPVAELPAAPGERPQTRANADAAAIVFRRRVNAVDRVVRAVIKVSGIGIIAAVLGIGLFLVLEVVPLWRPPRVAPAAQRSVLSALDPARLVILDEHQQQAAVIGSRPRVHVVSLIADAPPREVAIPGLEGQRITAAIRADEHTVLGTDRGTAWIGRLELVNAYESGRRDVRLVLEPELMLEAVPGSSISALAYRELGDERLLAVVANGTHLVLVRLTVRAPLVGAARKSLASAAVPLRDLGRPTGLAFNERGTQLVIGTSSGLLARWRLSRDGAAELVETTEAVRGGAVSALAHLIGGRSLIVGGSDGSLAAWSLVPDGSAADDRRLTAIHALVAHRAAVCALVASPRDKGLISISTDRVAQLHYVTAERRLAGFTLGEAPVVAAFGPKANALAVVGSSGRLAHWRIDNPHPEVNARALFGKVWYEGYERPEYVWQSSGGTDDFEPKLSLVPLVFGTLKGTCYAMLFAAPLALLGALYCSQFLDRRLAGPVKSTIELMAALPSVVLGFVAGVFLAPFVEGRIVSALAMPVVMPAGALLLLAGLQRLPDGPLRRALAGREFATIVAGSLAGALAAWWAGPWLERWLFDGQFRAWLAQRGVGFDQRNAMVVGWVVGFAVIPIVFTICEDAFSAVPRHLVGASLACGASRWQTAWRVILPAAGSGVFSAMMVGLGRAIGETMIVVMATGNTPIMDWNPFSGFRALSANIAVEIPEAPYGGTLYRVLFVAALLLFGVTSIVNTAAEVVRLRLRAQLKGL